jgi:hypothetical protein
MDMSTVDKEVRVNVEEGCMGVLRGIGPMQDLAE